MDTTPPPPSFPVPPAAAPTGPDPAAGQPLVEYIRTQRTNAAYALLGLSVVLLVLTGWFAVRGFRSTTVAPAPADEKDKMGKMFDTPELEKPDTARVDYVVAGLGTLSAFLVTGALGAWLLAAPPKPTAAAQRTDARVVLLAAGGLLGLIAMLVGVVLFYRWSDAITAWLDRGEAKQARWVLYPFLMIVAGAGLVFAAVQPARADERNNPTLRRLVYGSNFALTTLLLFAVLVVANVLIGMKLPNRLDTTSTGFYSLSKATTDFVGTLEQPVTAYAILGEGDPVNDDIKRLLQGCQDANPGKFRVRVLSPALNREDVRKLRSDYPQAELSQEGVLLVAGDESLPPTQKRHTFIRAEEFSDESMAGGKPQRTFVGESKLLRELRFIGESKVRPVVYFTQSSGELGLAVDPAGGERVPPRRSAVQLKEYLEKNYVDARPLPAPTGGGAARVPDDAAAVVVADPTAPLPPETVKALTDYMQQPRGERKGKLVVLAGRQVGPDRRPLKLGIEPLLAQYGVSLPDRFVYSAPIPQLDAWDQANGIRTMLVEVHPAAVEARNPVALAFHNKPELPMIDCRDVGVRREGGGPVTATPALISSRGRQTWVEAEAVDPRESAAAFRERYMAIQEINDRSKAEKEFEQWAAHYQPTTSARSLSAFAAEGQTARVAVFGCGWFVSDEAAGRATRATRGQAATLYFDLIGATLDWVRDRPVVADMEAKKYTSVALPPGADTIRLIWFPIGLGLLVVAGLAAGVWVIRRK